MGADIPIYYIKTKCFKLLPDKVLCNMRMQHIDGEKDITHGCELYIETIL